MKKIISLLLIFTLCLGCFVGCSEEAVDTQPSESASAGDLNNAKTFLFNLYKDNARETPAAYSVVSQVIIGGVTYPVTWSTDVAAEIVYFETNAEGATVVYVNGDSEPIDYKLIGTIKDAAGNTITVEFLRTIPQTMKLPTEAFVLMCADDGAYVTGNHYLYTGKNKYQLVMSKDKAAAVPMTAVRNPDGTVSFMAEGKYLYCDATHVMFTDKQDDNTKFALTETEDGMYIQCAVANFGGKAQYLESYKTYLTCYGMQESQASIYTFRMEPANGASGTIQNMPTELPGQEPAPEPTPNPGTDAPAVSGTYSKISELNDGDKIVIVNPASNKAFSMTKTGFYNNGVDVAGDNFSSITANEILVAKKNADGSWSFATESGAKLAMAESFSSMSEDGVHSTWTLEDAGSGNFYLKNNGRDLYLEWYASKNNWSGYNPSELNQDYILAFYKLA